MLIMHDIIITLIAISYLQLQDSVIMDVNSVVQCQGLACYVINFKFCVTAQHLQ